MTSFQTKLVAILKDGQLAPWEIAARASTSRIAVWSALHSLRRQGLANYFRVDDQPKSGVRWYLKS